MRRFYQIFFLILFGLTFQWSYGQPKASSQDGISIFLIFPGHDSTAANTNVALPANARLMWVRSAANNLPCGRGAAALTKASIPINSIISGKNIQGPPISWALDQSYTPADQCIPGLDASSTATLSFVNIKQGPPVEIIYGYSGGIVGWLIADKAVQDCHPIVDEGVQKIQCTWAP